MTNIEKQLDETKTVVDGRLRQAKGVVQEQVGNLTDDKKGQLAGKKEQVLGKMQANYGNSWAFRHSQWLLLAALLALGGLAVAFIRSRVDAPFDDQYQQ